MKATKIKKKATKKLNVYTGFQEIKNENVLKFEAAQPPEYAEYRRKWEEYPEKLIVPKFPLNVDIGATSKCNLKCPMCTRTQYIKAGKFIKIQDFDMKLYKKVVDEGAKNGLYALNLDNFGEAFMNPHIYEMVRYAKSKKILDVFFHTNASLMSEKKARKIIAAGLDRLIFSFDSPYKKKYEAIRIGTTYENTLGKIRAFAALKKKLGVIKPITRINCIRFPNTTQKEIDDTVKLFAPIVDAVSFIDYVNPVKSRHGVYKKGYISKFVCPQLLTRLTVWEDGVISPCCMDYDRTLGLGNVKNTTLKQAWDSPKRKSLLKKHLEGKFFDIAACRNCDFAISGDLEARHKKTMTAPRQV